MNDRTPLLELKGVCKSYPSSSGGQPLDILRDISLRVDAGDRVSIMGPSGSGKSTLLNIMGSLDRPTRGQVLLRGSDLATHDDAALSSVRNRRIGFIFQDHHLLPQCTVLENVLVPVLVTERRAGGKADRARAMLDRVGMADRVTHRPGQLSGGECQRVAVVRALINRPDLLLADEPTGSLDGTNAEQLADLLVELNAEENVALVLVTHAADIAARMDRTLVLHNGGLDSPPHR